MSVNEYPQKRDADGRFCYGANCTWIGSIHEVGSTKPLTYGHSLPCCPLCGGMLFEMPDEGEWWESIDAYERGDYPTPTAHPHPGYRAMWEWQRAQKKCFSQGQGKGLAGLVAAYKDASGVTVETER